MQCSQFPQSHMFFYISLPVYFHRFFKEPKSYVIFGKVLVSLVPQVSPNGGLDGPQEYHCIKSEVFLFRIQFECGEIRTRKTSNTDTFHTVYNVMQFCVYLIMKLILLLV